MPRPIVAAIDPRREDVAPAALGAQLARLTGARLVLAAAYRVDGAADAVYREYGRALRAEVEQALEHARVLLADGPGMPLPISATAVHWDQSPALALHELAVRERAGALVLGSSARGRSGRVLPRAVTDRLLHGAPCPVAVAPAGFSLRDGSAPPRVVGVAFVDTPEGHAALHAGCSLAARASALVRVVTVKEPWGPLALGTVGGLALIDNERAHTEAAERVLAVGLAAVPAARSAGGEVLSGRPADALAAASGEFDLLVCGSRGRGPARTLLLGGTSHALVRSAACPILVVPSAAGEAGAPEAGEASTAS